MKKRLMSAAVAAVLAGSLVTGCGSGAGTSGFAPGTSAKFSTSTGDEFEVGFDRSGEDSYASYKFQDGLVIAANDSIAAVGTFITDATYESALVTAAASDTLSLVDEGATDDIVYNVVSESGSYYGIIWLNGTATGIWLNGYGDVTSLISVMKAMDLTVISSTSQAKTKELQHLEDLEKEADEKKDDDGDAAESESGEDAGETDAETEPADGIPAGGDSEDGTQIPIPGAESGITDVIGTDDGGAGEESGEAEDSGSAASGESN